MGRVVRWPPGYDDGPGVPDAARLMGIRHFATDHVTPPSDNYNMPTPSNTIGLEMLQNATPISLSTDFVAFLIQHLNVVTLGDELNIAIHFPLHTHFIQ